ncbi:MAG: 50S ribosomal protein L15 [Proteobacteria bacterium]|nr:50S ribosomal protein L15 [Pseudomonadota bacterium]
MKLNELRDNPAAKKDRTRVGRGPGSGKGRTTGRGMKGQKSRSGVAIKGFEGGQMPIHRRLPKRGFTNIFRKTYALANLGRIQKAIDDKKLDALKPVTAAALCQAGVIHSAKQDVKLLAKGELKAKLTIEVATASSAAIAAVEKAGGKVAVTLDRAAEEARKAAKADRRRSKGKKAGKKAAQQQAKAEGEAKAKGEAKAGGEAKQKTEAKAEGEAKQKTEAKAEGEAKQKTEAKAEGEAKAKDEAKQKDEAKPAAEAKEKE